MEVLKNNEQKTTFTSIPNMMTQTALLIPSVMVTKESLQNPKQHMIYDLSAGDYDPLFDSYLWSDNAMQKPVYTSQKSNQVENINKKLEQVLSRAESKQKRLSSKKRSRRNKRTEEESKRNKNSSRAGKITPLGSRAVRKG